MNRRETYKGSSFFMLYGYEVCLFVIILSLPWTPAMAETKHSKGGFALWVQDQRSYEFKQSCWVERNIILGPKQFTMGSESKSMRKWSGANDVAPLFYSISFIRFQENIAPHLRTPHVKLGSDLESKSRGLLWGVLLVSWTPSFWDLNTMICGVIQLLLFL